MSKPMIHARSSARRYGGTADDYIAIHDFIDSSKAAFPDNRHRALTHNSWFIFIVEKVFGHEIEVVTQPGGKCACGLLDGRYVEGPCHECSGTGMTPRLVKPVSVRDVAEQHILEDFGGKYIPTVADYLDGMEFHDWMNNGIKGSPPSHRKIREKHRSPRTPDPVQAAGDLVLDARRNFTLD